MKYNPPEYESLDLARARYNHRQRIAEIVGWTVGCCVAAIAIVVVAYIVWRANAGPSAEEQLQHQEAVSCTTAGGTWLRVEDGDSSTGFGTCTYGRDSQ